MKTSMPKIFLWLLICATVFSHVEVRAAIVYSYDGLGRITKVNFGNGVETNYTYDAAGNRLSYSALAAPQGPTISNHPQPVNVPTGGPASFSVIAAGAAPLSYQWRRAGQPVAGGSAATLSLSAVTAANAGAYTVVVSDPTGSTTSQPALLTVFQTSFAGWQTAFFTPEEIATPAGVAAAGSDPNNDGISNWMAFVSGLHPRESGTPGALPVTSIQEVGGNRYLTFRYRQLLGLTSIPYTVCVSDELAIWDETEAQIEQIGDPVPSGDGLTETVTVRLKTPLNDPQMTRKFLRLKVGSSQTTATLFEDNFDDNSLDPAKWSMRGNTVTETGQTMQLFANQTDNVGVLTSQPFQLQGRGPITMTRRAKVHYGNNYAIPTFVVKIGTTVAFQLHYANMAYNGAPHRACYGTTISGANGNPHSLTGVNFVSTPIPTLWDTWYQEKVVFVPDTGNAQYFVNDELKIEYNVGILPVSVGTAATLEVNAWGWWTGHQHLFDDLKVDQTTSP